MDPNESETSGKSGASTAESSPQTSPTRNGTFTWIGPWASQLESMFVRRLLVIAVLSAMVMIGLFLSNYSSERARYYWCAMFPIFGLACLAHELTINRVREITMLRLLLRQALHWIGSVVAVKILFLQYARGQMASDAVALATILLLAVTCFLAGAHFDGSFYWVSALLVLAAVIWHRSRKLSLVGRGSVSNRSRHYDHVGDIAASRPPRRHTLAASSGLLELRKSDCLPIRQFDRAQGWYLA